MNKIILAMVTVVTVFAGGLGILSSAQSANAEEAVAYLPTVTASGKTLSFEVPSSNIGTRSIQMDLGVPYSDTEMGRYLNTSGKSWTFENASLEAPVLVRARQWVQLSTADGVRHLYSSWSDWFVLPYDGAVSSVDVHFFFSVAASGAVSAVFPNVPASDNPLYCIGPGVRLGPIVHSSLSIPSGSFDSDVPICIAAASSAGYGPVCSYRPLIFFGNRIPTFDSSENAIVLNITGFNNLQDEPGEDYYFRFRIEYKRGGKTVSVYLASAYERVLGTSIKYVSGTADFLGKSYEFQPGDEVSFYAEAKKTSDASSTDINYTFRGQSGVLLLTEELLNPPDPVDPDPDIPDPDDPDNPNPDNPDPEPPADGGNVFDQINALGEPWSILIYIAGGCLIVMALGSLFGRR